MSFDEIFETWNWKPIAGCAGRFVMRDARADLPPEEIIGREIEMMEFEVRAAKDTVIVARLSDGGLISYKRYDGTFIHTLNTNEGFARKLEQLGIDLRDGSFDRRK